MPATADSTLTRTRPTNLFEANYLGLSLLLSADLRDVHREMDRKGAVYRLVVQCSTPVSLGLPKNHFFVVG